MKIEPTDNCKDVCSSPAFMDMSRRRFLVGAGVLTAGLSTGPLLAADQSQRYAQVVKGHASLRGYWRFDGDLTDVMGKAPVKADGTFSYGAGAIEGQAVSLVPNEPLSVKNAEHLRGRSATIELFFKVASKPSADEDPVLIAQTSGQQIRYIVGIANDLSALLYRGGQNPNVLTKIELPTGWPFR